MKSLPKGMHYGDIVWHRTRQDFCKIVRDTGDPTSVIVQFEEGEDQEVTVALLEPPLFPQLLKGRTS